MSTKQFRKFIVFSIFIVLLALISLNVLSPQAHAASNRPPHPTVRNSVNEPGANFLIFDSGVPFLATLYGTVGWTRTGPPIVVYNITMSAYVPNGTNPAYYPFDIITFTELQAGNTTIRATDANNCIYPRYTAMYCGDNFNYWTFYNEGFSHYEQAYALSQAFTPTYNHNW
ncbi:MAG: hypothetical protein WCD86_04925 [Ktedonobacteraceae bacterium]